MTFAWPHAFWFLLVPLALLARDLLRRRTASADAHPKIPQASATPSSLVIGHRAFRRGGAHRARILLYAALAAATVALARPQWGRLEEPVYVQANDVIIALDLSRSMLAQDVKPSRLERARLLITGLLERLAGERVGLVVFSGTAFLQSPLSADYEILREFLPVLEPGYLPEGGTNYDVLLETALSAFNTSDAADRFLIILSDGEALSDTWRKHLDDLKAKNIRVLGLGLGTSEGAMIPDGSGAFMKDERGAVVLSKLNTTTLRELADKTSGTYADASAWVDLAQLLRDTVEQGRRGEFQEASRVRLAERFQWPLATALLLFLLSFWREFPVHPKPRPLQLASPAKSVTTLALFLALLSSFAIGHSSLAAESGDAPPTAALSAPVTQIVSRLSTRLAPTAADYAELARATATYGERARASNEAVPEPVVRDALAAVIEGQRQDPKAADWPALRRQLEALLPKKDPPPPKQDEQKQPDQKKEKNEKPNEQQQDSPQGEKGEASDQNNEQSDSKPDASKPEDQKSGQGDQQSDAQSNGADAGKKPDKPGQSAFGEMENKDSPEKKETAAPVPAEQSPAAPDPSEMQQVGGTAGEQSTDPARTDPTLVIPMQKLDQVRQGDSPARLFQILQGPPAEPSPDSKKGPNW